MTGSDGTVLQSERTLFFPIPPIYGKPAPAERPRLKAASTEKSLIESRFR